MRRCLLLSLLLSLLAISFPLAVPAAPVTVRILHVNDFHGFANPVVLPGETVSRGGAARLAARIAALRQERPSLVLAAGDMIAGDPWANLFQGESAVTLMNRIGLDAMVLGNHEFDFGRDALAQRIAEARFPVLGANVEGMAGLHPYVIREVAGLRVAIAGLVTDDTPTTSHPRNTTGLTFRSPLATAARLVAELRPRVDLIVLLTHIGFSADRALAERLAGDLVIVGGHSHTRVEQPVRIDGKVVVQAWEHGQALGVLDVTVDHGRIVAASGRLEEIRGDRGTGDQGVRRLVEEYNERLGAALEEPVGETSVDLVAAGARRRETNFGDLVAEIMRQAAGAEAALINGGSLRAGIGRGPIRARDLAAALPFPNHLVTLKLTGSDLRQALEHGVSAVENDEGRFPQVAGIRFAFSPQAPAGQRLREVEVAGRPLTDDRVYRVVTTDFLAAGGDGYRVLSRGGATESEPGRLLRDLVSDYLRGRKQITPAADGRIREVP